jgi:hypothetical protein
MVAVVASNLVMLHAWACGATVRYCIGMNVSSAVNPGASPRPMID